MPRRGDGIYARGKSWYLDCRIDGRRLAVAPRLKIGIHEGLN